MTRLDDFYLANAPGTYKLYHNKMTRFEPQISGFGSYHSTNWAPTTACSRFYLLAVIKINHIGIMYWLTVTLTWCIFWHGAASTRQRLMILWLDDVRVAQAWKRWCESLLLMLYLKVSSKNKNETIQPVVKHRIVNHFVNWELGTSDYLKERLPPT